MCKYEDVQICKWFYGKSLYNQNLHIRIIAHSHIFFCSTAKIRTFAYLQIAH